jgi:hypothetical protein
MSVLIIILMIMRKKDIKNENLLFILGYSCFTLIDIFCFFYYKVTKLPTDIFYTVGFLTIVFFLYLFYYFKLLYLKPLRKIQFTIILLFVLNILIQIIINQNAFLNFSFNWLYINILLLLFSIILFLYQTFNSNKILHIKHYLPFWISVSLLIFFIGSIPIFYFRHTISEQLYFIILLSLNIISNLIIARGVLWHKHNCWK